MKITLIALAALFSIHASAGILPEIKNESPLLIKKKSKALKPLQEEIPSKQVVKINITQLPLRNFSIQYEYGFRKNMSAALGISLVTPRNISKIIYNPPSSTEGWQLPKFSGFYITPEFRFYPGKKELHRAPHGFYIAPYFRYSKYTLKADYLELYNNNTQTRTYKGTVTYGGITGGIMIGSQWIINKHFSIDWWIAGIGGGSGKFYADVVSDGTLNLSTQEQEDLKNDIKNNLDKLDNFAKGIVDIQTTPNSATINVKNVPMVNYRGFGINLGYAF